MKFHGLLMYFLITKQNKINVLSMERVKTCGFLFIFMFLCVFFFVFFVRVFVFMCVCVCISLCVFVCMCVYMYVWLFQVSFLFGSSVIFVCIGIVCMFHLLGFQVFVCVFFVCVHFFVSLCACMCVLGNVFGCVCTHVEEPL